MMLIDTKLSCTCPVPAPPEHPLRSSDASLIGSCASDPVVPMRGVGGPTVNPSGVICRFLSTGASRGRRILSPPGPAPSRGLGRPHALVGLRRLTLDPFVGIVRIIDGKKSAGRHVLLLSQNC